MMKKILSATLLLGTALAFTACAGEEDDVFDQSAAERLQASKVTYTQRFAAATAGWAMEYYPTNGNSAPRGQGYLMLTKFNADGSVRIAMQNEMTDDQYVEDTSLWEMIADQGPVLSFNSYNSCLHLFSNPAIFETGLGYEGDYEFEVIDLPENGEYAMLKGKKRGTYIRLTRLEEGTEFQSYFSDINEFLNKNFPRNVVNPVLLSLNDSLYVVSDACYGVVSMYPYGGDAISETTTHPFLVTKRDGKFYMRFRDSFTAGDDASVKEFVFDEANDNFQAVDAVNMTAQITGYYKGQFVMEQIEAGKSWELTATSSMSDNMQACITKIADSFKARNITLNNLRLVKYTEKDGTEHYTWRLTYKERGKNATSVNYFFGVQREGDKISFTYERPEGNNGELMFSVIDGIQELITEKFVQGFTVEKTESDLVLNTVKFTSVSDPNVWFVLAIK